LPPWPFLSLLSECLLLFISLSTQSGNFWLHSRTLQGYVRRRLEYQLPVSNRMKGKVKC